MRVRNDKKNEKERTFFEVCHSFNYIPVVPMYIYLWLYAKVGTVHYVSTVLKVNQISDWMSLHFG